MHKLIRTTAFSFAFLCIANVTQAFAAGSTSTVTTSASTANSTTTSAVAPASTSNVPTVAQYLSPVSQAPVQSKVSVPDHPRPLQKQHARHPAGMHRHPGAVNTAVSASAA